MNTSTLLEKIQDEIFAYTGELDYLIELRKTGRIEEDRYQKEYVVAVNNRAKLIDTISTIKGYI